jgi:serine/threonine protein kinase
MKHITHPNIAKLNEVLSSHSKIYLVLELVTGGELFHRLKENGAMSESESRYYFQQIISGVSFCAKQRIAHRDLKLENILLDEKGTVKISDFGLSGLFNYDPNKLQLMHTTCGTVNYLAPEVFGNLGYDGHVADIWSCGVILYALLTGMLPFEDDLISRLIEKIVSANYEMPKTLSSEAQDLISQILNPDPRTRITIQRIKEHPWFMEGYYEPEGIFEEVDERQVNQALRKSTEIIDVPRPMSGFELIMYCGGMVMNKMFDNGQSHNHAIHFLTEQNPEVISTRLYVALQTAGAKVRRDTNYRMNAEFKNPKLIFQTVEMFEIVPNLYIVVFTRSSGNLQSHIDAFERVKSLLADIVQ